MKFLKQPQEVDAIQLKLELRQPDGQPILPGSWLVQDEQGQQCIMEDERFRASYTPIYELPAQGKGLFERLSEAYEREHPRDKRRPSDFGQAIVDESGTRHFLHKKPPSWDQWAQRFWNRHKGDEQE